METTTYFTGDSLKFLKELREHNERGWFERNRPRYESKVRDSFLHLIADLQAPLKKINPGFVADPRPTGGSMMRIYRDIRFSADKSPYKTAVAAHFGSSKQTDGCGPAYYLRIEPGNSMIGAGLWHPDTNALGKIREAIVAKPERWRRITSGAVFGSSCGMSGESLKRPPRGIDPNHPLIEDLKRKDFVISSSLTDEEVCGPGLLDSISEAYRMAAPFVQFLAEAVEASGSEAGSTPGKHAPRQPSVKRARPMAAGTKRAASKG
ncbi:MAG TPA: DUF2461 domain-containing protein [Candidatus Binataceae bacterium]|nr:DUF2461 domain-containing protein [Candidatus Binataceae bacterium]